MDIKADVPLESTVREIGRALYASAATSRPALYRARGVRGALLARALEDDALRRALFQFVDVLPQLDDSTTVARHFNAYLEGRELEGLWGRVLRLGNYPLMAGAVRASV